MRSPSPLVGEGGARAASAAWEGEGAPTYEELLARAQWMRKNPTDAERRMWSMLRDRRLSVYKFKRQQVIAPYIVDFVCLAERLIIEVDGSQHAESAGDLRRDTYLRAQGFRILRFWNNHVLGSGTSVGDAIYFELTSPHPPTRSAGGPLPLPQGERGLENDHA